MTGKNQKNRIVLILGSGISIPVKMSSMDELTQKIILKFNADQIKLYRLVSDMFRESIIIKMVHPNIFSINYEDFYGILYEMYENICKGRSALPPYPGTYILQQKLHSQIEIPPRLIRNTTDLIQQTVVKELSSPPKCIEKLNFFRDVCQDKDIDLIDIFTLNHDTIIEQLLSKNNISYFDGFAKENNSIRKWNPSIYKQQGRRINLFKLHGSINWIWLRPEDEESKIGFVGCMDTDQRIPGKMTIGSLNYSIDHPLVLIGSNNKLLEYTVWLYSEIQCHLLDSLKNCNTLISCGYGFGDIGINAKINGWLGISENNNHIVIDPKADDFSIYAKGERTRDIFEAHEINGIKPISERIETVKWQDIKKLIKFE